MTPIQRENASLFDVQRTKPSKEGKDYLYQNMSNALTAAGITFSAYS